MKTDFSKKKSGGLTLIEILVVIGVIVLLSALTLSQYRAGQNSLALQRSAHKLVQDIRRAQEMAMSAKELPEGGFPEGGYGIYFDRSTGHGDYDVFIYADDNNSGRYESGELEIEEISLEKEIKIKDVEAGPANPDTVSVTFKPPDPKVILWNEFGMPFDNIKIEICLKTNESQNKFIKVNKAGLIYIAD